MKVYVWKLVEGHKQTVFEYSLLNSVMSFEDLRNLAKGLVEKAKIDYDGIDIVKGAF